MANFTNKQISIDKRKLEKYENYCKRTGRVFSRMVEIAVEEYMKNNPCNDLN